MAHRNNCVMEMLGQASYCAVAVCRECGVYHVHAGPTTIRMGRETFEQFCELIASLHSRSGIDMPAAMARVRSH